MACRRPDRWRTPPPIEGGTVKALSEPHKIALINYFLFHCLNTNTIPPWCEVAIIVDITPLLWFTAPAYEVPLPP